MERREIEKREKQEVNVKKVTNNPDVAKKGQTNIDKFLVNKTDIVPAFFKDFKSSSTGFFKSFGFGSSKNTPTTSTPTSSTPTTSTPTTSTSSTPSIPSAIKSIMDKTGLSQLPIGTTVSRVISYLLAIVIVVFVILLFVHYFIKPIFSLQPGSPGLIPVPGFDNGILYWDKTNPGEIANAELPISEIYYNYSLIVDIYIQNPFQFSKSPRILFSRGATYKQSNPADTILGIVSNYNMVFGLLPDTNDLIISTLNKDNNMENAIIPNIPVQKSFRLGIILMENALEVYVNGHLMKTRKFSSCVKDVKGNITPSKGIESSIAKMRNLKIWPKVLTTSEIRYAKPPMSSDKDFSPKPMPNSSTCASNVMSSLDGLYEDGLDALTPE